MIGTRPQSGFILPAALMLSLGLSIISATFAQYIIHSSNVLSQQSYTGLAEEAANSGIAYAVGCFASGTNDWPSPLDPSMSCSADPLPGTSEYMAIAKDKSWRSTFTIARPSTSGSVTAIVATGTVEAVIGSSTFTVATAKRSVTMTSVMQTTPSPHDGGDTFTDLSSDSHSCAIANGKLYCWGRNASGQLGLGTTTAMASPQLVAATNPGDAFLNKVVTMVAVGTENTCAVAAGQLYCWGDNTYGQLGLGTSDGNQSTPQAVIAPLENRKITHLALSQSAPTSKSACAVADGITYCWGSNSNQQLGQTVGSSVDTTNRSTPTPIYGYRSGDPASAPLYGKKSQSASVGARNGCATAIGKMYCWGNIDNPSVQAPVADMTSSSWQYNYGNPVLPWSVKVIGNNSCSVTNYLICGGNGAFGTYNPADIVGWGTTTLDYDAGETNGDTSTRMNCILLADLYCNGGSNAYLGRYGLGLPPSTGSYEVSQRLISKVGVGNQYGCMIPNGGLACWGRATEGQLGNGSMTGVVNNAAWIAPSIGFDNTPLGTFPRFSASGPISVGKNHACALANGSFFCWGDNDTGQLGVGGTVDQAQPTVINTTQFPTTGWPFYVPINTTKEKIVAGGDHSCAIAGGEDIVAHDLYCWGSNSYGELGRNNTTNSDIPRRVSLSGRVTDVSAGERNTCAIADSRLYCWGDDTYGQIGDGTPGGIQTTPRQVVFSGTGKQVTSVSVGTNHVCAIVSGDGYCWGSNANYATGLNTNSSTPTLPNNGRLTLGAASTTNGNVTAAFTAIAAGDDYSCAVINGVASCWGKSNVGQTGTGSSTFVTIPTVVSGPAATMQATRISTGTTHACATIEGAFYCWGNQDRGRVGDGVATGSQLTPKLVDGGAAVGRAGINVAAGDSTSCGIANGLILCWGVGTLGQIGDNSLTDSLAPSVVTRYRTQGNSSVEHIY